MRGRGVVTISTVNAIDTALELLRQSRELLKQSRCRQSVDAVRRAMKSVEGAKRHAIRAMDSAYYKWRREQEEADHERLAVMKGAK